MTFHRLEKIAEYMAMVDTVMEKKPDYYTVMEKTNWARIRDTANRVPIFEFDEELAYCEEYQQFGLELMTENIPIMPFRTVYFGFGKRSLLINEVLEPEHVLHIIPFSAESEDAASYATVPTLRIKMKDVHRNEAGQYRWHAVPTAIASKTLQSAEDMLDNLATDKGRCALTTVCETAVSMAAALMSKDVEKYPGTVVSERIQRKREARGEPRINNPTIVRLSKAAREAVASYGARKGKGKVKMHYRRGHIRTLAHNGKRVPVAPCIINADSNEAIQAKYKVKA
jgi:hypothetical protein